MYVCVRVCMCVFRGQVGEISSITFLYFGIQDFSPNLDLINLDSLASELQGFSSLSLPPTVGMTEAAWPGDSNSGLYDCTAGTLTDRAGVL